MYLNLANRTTVFKIFQGQANLSRFNLLCSRFDEAWVLGQNSNFWDNRWETNKLTSLRRHPSQVLQMKKFGPRNFKEVAEATHLIVRNRNVWLSILPSALGHCQGPLPHKSQMRNTHTFLRKLIWVKFWKMPFSGRVAKTAPTSWCYFFWPVLIFGKNRRKQAKNRRFFGPNFFVGKIGRC